jgi:branched-chain amino acid transport system substrate-binding protein
MIRLDNVLKVPTGRWQPTQTADFVMEYRAAYGNSPGLAAVYAYDGMNAIIGAITLAGSHDREKIQYALAKMNLNGVTGHVQFDSRGNRSGPLYLTFIKNGLPVQ